MQTDLTNTRGILTIREYAAATGQTGQAVRAQIAAGTCPAQVVILRKPARDREGGRPRYAVTRASVDRLLGEAAPAGLITMRRSRAW